MVQKSADIRHLLCPHLSDWKEDKYVNLMMLNGVLDNLVDQSGLIHRITL